DGDHEVPARQRRRDLTQHGRHDLWLHGEHDHVRLAHELDVALRAAHGVAPVQLGEAVVPRVRDDDEITGHHARLDQPLHEGLAHVPAADEAETLALDAHSAAFGERGWPG